MSVKSVEPKSNLDRYAYLLNAFVIVLAVTAVFVSIYFLERVHYYPYYWTIVILLLMLSAVSIFLSVNSIFFFFKVYGKEKFATNLLLVIGLGLIIIGIVTAINSVNFQELNNLQLSIADHILDPQFVAVFYFVFGLYFLYIGIILTIRCLLNKRVKKELY